MTGSWLCWMIENMEQFEQIKERVVLVGVSWQEGDDAWDSLEELAELAQTAGAQVVGTVIQSREGIHPGAYVGTGKLQEIRQLLLEADATGIVCDDELSPAQLRNMEDALECKIMDRTLLILDIFAARASTSEGKIQVELAQLRYRMSRLAGLGTSLSRLGGGIGTRGPGEKKLEMDRRLIKSRISRLKRELLQVQQHREVARGQRSRSRIKTAAIVGYTNAGKSTLLNQLTDANVLEEDKLFATLDPTTRILKLDSGQELLLTDTVGFIRKLPHHLIEAFQSTLEEAKYADFILHVVDASNPQREKQMHIVYETLRELGITGKKVITLFNKQDKLQEPGRIHDARADRALRISAKRGYGMDSLKRALEDVLREDKRLLEGVFPYGEGGQVSLVRKFGELLEEEYQEKGIYIKAFVPVDLYRKLEMRMESSM